MRTAILLTALAATLAWAGTKAIIYSQTGTAQQGPPTTKTAGVPTQHQDGTDLKAVHITISNPDDAGAGDEPQTCLLRAWKYTAQNVATDGGVGYGWSRYPRLDLMVGAFDAGIETASKYVHVSPGGVTVSVPIDSLAVTSLVPMANGSRLAWDEEWCVGGDAGVLATGQLQMATTGVY